MIVIMEWLYFYVVWQKFLLPYPDLFNMYMRMMRETAIVPSVWQSVLIIIVLLF